MAWSYDSLELCLTVDSVDTLCSCGNDIESTVHFFLHCPNFCNSKTDPFEQTKKY